MGRNFRISKLIQVCSSCVVIYLSRHHHHISETPEGIFNDIAGINPDHSEYITITSYLFQFSFT
jgi:hypothetical protein